LTEPPRRPPAGPRPLTGSRTSSRSPSSIGALLEQARDVSARAGGVVIDREAWRRAVGDRIAARTEPGRLRNGVLTLHVASAAWAQELSFFGADLLARVKALGVPASSLRFQVRPVATQKTPERSAPELRPRAVLPPDIEARLRRVEDPALRAAIAAAAALGLAPRTGAASSAARVRGPRSAAERSARPDRTSPDAPRAPRRKP
jgi:hypothetical protein